jgi:hypothetical protein
MDRSRKRWLAYLRTASAPASVAALASRAGSGVLASAVASSDRCHEVARELSQPGDHGLEPDRSARCRDRTEPISARARSRRDRARCRLPVRACSHSGAWPGWPAWCVRGASTRRSSGSVGSRRSTRGGSRTRSATAHPVMVRLHDAPPLGDVGNARVDARLLNVMLAADGRMARMLRAHGGRPRRAQPARLTTPRGKPRLHR